MDDSWTRRPQLGLRPRATREPTEVRRCCPAEGADLWLVDKPGLLLDSTSDLRDFQQPYARPASEAVAFTPTGSIDLIDVVANVHPTILVGTSTAGGAFTEQVVREMAAHVERPLIFPLSNPTERIEAVPSDVVKWTAAG